MLNMQFRMHKDISDWASEKMYRGLLKPHRSVAGRTLEELPNFICEVVGDDNERMSSTTLLLIDSTGCGMPESSDLLSGSKYNENEALTVVDHVERLITRNVSEEDIAVITPYNGQVGLLKALLGEKYKRLEIRSVDGFQGGEKECVVLSLVRSNKTKEVGFLKDNRRLNVAVTRAKRHLAVVCDVECVSADSFVKGLCDWIEVKGEVRSAIESKTLWSVEANKKAQAYLSQLRNVSERSKLVPRESPFDLALVKGACTEVEVEVEVDMRVGVDKQEEEGEGKGGVKNKNVFDALTAEDDDDIDSSVEPIHEQEPEEKINKTCNKKKKNKKKKSKLSKEEVICQVIVDNDFLDEEIKRVQNSHERKVEGGSKFQSIISKILLTKYEATTTPTKSKHVSNSLREKLKKKG